MQTWDDKPFRHPRPVTIRFRISEFENEILGDACFLDERAVQSELEKRGLGSSSSGLESPATWAREVILNVALEKLRNASPEEKALLREIGEAREEEKARLKRQPQPKAKKVRKRQGP
jgi:hypothetical protein